METRRDKTIVEKRTTASEDSNAVSSKEPKRKASFLVFAADI